MTIIPDTTALEANDLWVAQEMVVWRLRGQKRRRHDLGSDVNKVSRVQRSGSERHKLQGLSGLDSQGS